MLHMVNYFFPKKGDVSDAVAVRRNRKWVKIVLPTVACSLMLTCVVFVMICKYKGIIDKDCCLQNST
jgi:hypothetical protein